MKTPRCSVPRTERGPSLPGRKYGVAYLWASYSRPKFAVRTVAGAAVGSLLAVMETQVNDPGADLGALIDAAFAHLETGLRL